MPHTPGPWKVSDTSIVTEDYCIAVIEDDGGYEAPSKDREANARLIAAAPDLLAALELIANTRDSFAMTGKLPKHCGDQCFDDWAADVASDAISKAKGQSS